MSCKDSCKKMDQTIKNKNTEKQGEFRVKTNP